MITAYNHPILFALSKIGAPLVAGNAVLIKPPEQASLSTLALARDLAATFPPGVVGVISGAAETGAALVNDPGVDLVSFTGSAPTGRLIMAALSKRLAPSILELGGKNAIVVFPDADVDAAAHGVFGAMALNVAGQSCQSGTRLFVHDAIADQLLAKLLPLLRLVNIGDPLEPHTEMGPLIDDHQHRRVMGFIDHASSQGAVLVGGGVVPRALGLDGYFIAPTVFDHVSGEMDIAQQEVFGPILSVLRWTDETEMFRIVNDTPYGLTASVWTQRRNAHGLVARLDVGYVWINHHGGALTGVPFGGWKQSGIGVEHSIEELYSCTRIKAVDDRS